MSKTRYEKGPIFHALVSCATSAAAGHVLVTAYSDGGKIRVIAFHAMTSAACKVRLKSASTLIDGPLPCGANGGLVLNENSAGHCQTLANQALRITLSATTPCGGSLTYQKVGGKVYSIDD